MRFQNQNQLRNILNLQVPEILIMFCRGEIQLLEKGYQRAVWHVLL